MSLYTNRFRQLIYQITIYLFAVFDCKILNERDLALHIFVFPVVPQAQCLARSRHTVTPMEYTAHSTTFKVNAYSFKVGPMGQSQRH